MNELNTSHSSSDKSSWNLPINCIEFKTLSNNFELDTPLQVKDNKVSSSLVSNFNSLTLISKKPRVLLPLNLCLYMDLRMREYGEEGFNVSQAIRDLKDGNIVLISKTLVSFKNLFKEYFKLNSKNISIFKQIKGGFLLLVPHVYLKNGLIGLGISPSQFKRVDSFSLIAEQKDEVSGNVEDLKHIFSLKSYPEKRIILKGHGMYSTEQLNFNGDQKANGIIAGLTINEYQDLLNFFSTIGTRILIVNSCYSAGHHFLAHQPTSKNAFSFPILVTCSNEDVAVEMNVASKDLFKSIDVVLSESSLESPVTLQQIQKIYRCFLNLEPPYVLLPDNTHPFTRAYPITMGETSVGFTFEYLESLLNQPEQTLDFSLKENGKKLLLYCALIPISLKIAELTQLESMIPGHSHHWFKKIFLSQDLRTFLKGLKNCIKQSPVNKSFFISKLNLTSSEKESIKLSCVCLDFSENYFKLTYEFQNRYYKLDKKDNEPIEITKLIALVRIKEAFLKSSPSLQSLKYATDGKETNEAIQSVLKNEYFNKLDSTDYELFQSLEEKDSKKVITIISKLSSFDLNETLSLLLLYKNIPALKWAVQNEANIDHVLSGGKNLLAFATYLQDLDFIKFLINQGAKVNKNKHQLLKIAIQTGSIPIVEYLIEQQIDENFIKDIPDLIYEAEVFEHLELANLLKKKFPIYDAMMAIYESNLHYFEDISSMSLSEKNILLEYALTLSRFSLVKKLIKQGADVNFSCTCYQRSAIFFAVENLDRGLMKFLLNYGVNLSKVDVFGNHILLHAIEYQIYKKDLSFMLYLIKLCSELIDEKVLLVIKEKDDIPSEIKNKLLSHSHTDRFWNGKFFNHFWIFCRIFTRSPSTP